MRHGSIIKENVAAGPNHWPTHRWSINVFGSDVSTFFSHNSGALQSLREMNKSFEFAPPEDRRVCAFMEKTASKSPPTDVSGVKFDRLFMYITILLPRVKGSGYV